MSVDCEQVQWLRLIAQVYWRLNRILNLHCHRPFPFYHDFVHLLEAEVVRKNLEPQCFLEDSRAGVVPSSY